MKKIFTLLLLSSAWLSSAQTNFNPADPSWSANLKGYWTFENAGNLGQATIGTNLTVINGALPFTQDAGPSALDKSISKPFVGDSMECTHGIAPNGGGARVNKYTLMVDFLLPDVAVGWNCLWNTDISLTTDGEFFFKTNQLGSGSMFGFYATPGSGLVDNQWYRLIITVDLTQPGGSQTKAYLDGVYLFSGANTYALDDTRVSLDTKVSLLGDEDGEEGEIKLGQVAMFDRALTAGEATTLGGPVLATPKFSAADNTLKVYPNPVSSNARISFNMPYASKNANIELIDMTGRVVENIYRGSLDQGEQTISWDLKSKYNAGTYLVKLSSENTNQVYSILMK